MDLPAGISIGGGTPDKINAYTSPWGQKKTPPRHGNQNMYMSMDKPMTLNRAEGTRGAQVENVKKRSKKVPPGHGNQNMYMSMDKLIALNSTGGTRGPQV